MLHVHVYSLVIIIQIIFACNAFFLQLEDITVLCQGNTCTPLGLPVAHECIIDVQTSNGDCSEEPSSNTITKDISHGNLSKCNKLQFHL